MTETHAGIQRTLALKGDPERRESTQRFFKEEVKAYGLMAPEVKKLAREIIRDTKSRSKEDIFALCEELWKSGFLEEAGLACELAYARRKNFIREDFSFFAAWVDRHINNWASCDVFCTRTLGAFIEMYPEYLGELRVMARSPGRWTKRAAAVTLIKPAARGLFLKEAFAIADILLEDPDDMVQKGYGWLLKSASNADPDAVFAYVMDKKAVMPRTALRYAIEKMPPEWRKEAMAK